MAPLNAQIEQVRGTLAELEGEMRAVEAELETFSADRLRFDALRDACNVLDRLDELEAGQLFWGEVPEFKDPAGHMARLRSRIARFDEEIGGVLEKQANLKAQVNQRLEELDYLYDEIRRCACSRREARGVNLPSNGSFPRFRITRRSCPGVMMTRASGATAAPCSLRCSSACSLVSSSTW